MDDRKAIKILGLSEVFSFNELKKAFRELLKKNHPDNYDQESSEVKEKASEKTREYIEAYEYLKNKYFPNDDLKKKINISYNHHKTSSEYEYTSSLALKRSLIYKLEKMTYANIFNQEPEIELILKELKRIYQKFSMIIMYDSDKTPSEWFEIASDEVKKLYNILGEVYFEKYGIDKQSINCEFTLESFWNELYEIRKSYENIGNVVKRLSDECEKYQKYYGYKYLKNFILKEIKYCAERIRKINGNTYIQLFIDIMHENIEDYFSNYIELILRESLEEYNYLITYSELLKSRIDKNVNEVLLYLKENNFDDKKTKNAIKVFQNEIVKMIYKDIDLIIDDLQSNLHSSYEKRKRELELEKRYDDELNLTIVFNGVQKLLIGIKHGDAELLEALKVLVKFNINNFGSEYIKSF